MLCATFSAIKSMLSAFTSDSMAILLKGVGENPMCRWTSFSVVSEVPFRCGVPTAIFTVLAYKELLMD
jgi:hypothetical protein